MFAHCSFSSLSLLKLSSLLALSLFATYSYSDPQVEKSQPKTLSSQSTETPISQITEVVISAQKVESKASPVEINTTETNAVESLPTETNTAEIPPAETNTAEITPAEQQAFNQEQQVNKVLDNLLHYATTANWDSYFALYTKNAVFIGTDATEHWNMVQFEKYARPTKGWNYTLIERKTVRHGDVIVFDELLDSKSYGISRGTGTLLLTEEGWKVAQYHLSFPIPNDIAKKVTNQIKATRK